MAASRIALAVALVTALVGALAYATVVDRALFPDSDAYMRLLRAERLWLSGDWYGIGEPRSNTPLGEILHWTRPLDVLVLLGAVPLSWFMEWRVALEAWGWLISPALLCLALVLLWRRIAFLVPTGWFAVLVFLMMFHPGLREPFALGRPDHHALLALFYILAVTWMLRGLAGLGERPFLWAGLCMGGGLWVSVEFLAPYGVVLAILGGLWVARGQKWAEALCQLAGATFAVTLLAVATERPPTDWATIELDRISAVHLLVCGLIALSAWGASRFPALLTDPRRRLLAGTAAALTSALVVALISPRFFLGPYAGADPYIQEVWLDQVAEVQPMIRQWPGEAVYALYTLAGALFALPLLWRRARAPEPAQALPALGLLVLIILFSALALAQARWLPYAMWPALLGWVMVLRATMNGPGRLRDLRFMLLFMGPALGLLLSTLVIGGPNDASAKRQLADMRLCDWRDVGGFLERAAAPGSTPLRLMNPEFDGGFVLFYTRHEVVATPFHRNIAGLRDSRGFFTATNMSEARAIMERRRLDGVLICRTGNSERGLREVAGDDSMIRRLDRGDPPAWLLPAKVEPGTAFAYFAFRPKASRQDLPSDGR